LRLSHARSLPGGAPFFETPRPRTVCSFPIRLPPSPTHCTDITRV
jgi:hypothetical protein